MHIQIKPDRNIAGREALADHVRGVEAVADKLSRLIEHTLGRAARSEGSQA